MFFMYQILNPAGEIMYILAVPASSSEHAEHIASMHTHPRESGKSYKPLARGRVGLVVDSGSRSEWKGS